MIAGLVAGLLAGYAVALPLGAIGSYLISLTARSSLRIGIAAALGVAVMDGIYALLAVLGGTAASAVLRPVAAPLRWSRPGGSRPVARPGRRRRPGRWPSSGSSSRSPRSTRAP